MRGELSSPPQLVCACGARADERIALLGAMQSLFEGSMYTFVFLWTPALSPAGERLPHGMIFACFMVASMAGARPAGARPSALPLTTAAPKSASLAGARPARSAPPPLRRSEQPPPRSVLLQWGGKHAHP
jgi:hypothetical protein